MCFSCWKRLGHFYFSDGRKLSVYDLCHKLGHGKPLGLGSVKIIKDQFSVQAVLLYSFQVKDGKLVRTEHARYERITYGTKKQYRIYTDSGIKGKAANKLDTVLNGYIWTFDSSYQNAIRLFCQRAEDDMVRAAVMSETARSCMMDVQAAEKELLFTGNVINLSRFLLKIRNLLFSTPNKKNI